MRLVNSNYNFTIELKENRIMNLVVENPVFLREIVQELYVQSLGDEGEFLLSENEKEVQINKELSIVLDPFSLDYNDKKIINKIYSQLQACAIENIEEKRDINTKILGVLEKIINQSQYNNLCYNLDLDWIQLMKMYNIHIELSEVDILNKMLEYEKIIVNILGQRILCMVNVKSYFQDEELKEIYKMAKYLKLHLLLIESREILIDECEHFTIIDKDRCVIVK